MVRALLTLAFMSTATAAFAVGTETNTPPAPTPTTTTCQPGQVWDANTGTCTAIEQSSLSEELLRSTARELAYAGRSGDALELLSLSESPEASEVLTLTAFAHGKAGDFDTALPIYSRALEADPDNLLARAYMGLALIASGRSDDAFIQLAQIRSRGGAESWPDRVLTEAIAADAPIGY